MVPSGPPRVRNDAFREPGVGALIAAVDPVTTRLGDELPAVSPRITGSAASERSYLCAITGGRRPAPARESIGRAGGYPATLSAVDEAARTDLLRAPIVQACRWGR
jgi:hypothetical protein